MTNFLRAAVVLGAALGPAASLAEPAPPASVQQCRVCHGTDGVGTNPMIPNLGGQSAEYLSKQLQDFRAGRREDPMMSIIAQGLSDEDIRELSAWYASVTATYELPQ